MNHKIKGTELFISLLHIQSQARIWHIQTKSYAEHKALNDFYEEIGDLQDKIIETVSGHYGLDNGSVGLKLDKYVSKEYTKEKLVQFAKGIDKFKITFKSKSDIVSILDDIDALTNRTLYLLEMS